LLKKLSREEQTISQKQGRQDNFQNNIDFINTGCLMKNASTHNFFIYYPISMNKKIEDMVFQALQNSHKMFFFLALCSIANFFFF
jgi:UDP-N-acetylglucosamine 2-epimerase